MAKIVRLSSEQREDLAAYLDGELDERRAQEIEQVLAESPVARHEVEMLSRTWDLLGTLPDTRASEEFTRKTLSSIRAAEQPGTHFDSAAFSRNARRAGTLVAWATALSLCAFLGFRATQTWFPNDADLLLNDFEVINRLDAYQAVGDIEFLKALQTNRTFADYHVPEEQH